VAFKATGVNTGEAGRQKFCGRKPARGPQGLAKPEINNIIHQPSWAAVRRSIRSPSIFDTLRQP